MLKQNTKKISIVGLGYVGLPLALLAEKKGYIVTGIDNDIKKIESINKRKSPFFDKELSKKLKISKIKATSDFSKTVDSSIVVICVPTPVYKNHMPNLEPVKSASKNVAKFLQKNQLVILESTVNPGVSENIVIPILEKESGLKCGKDFYLAHCPERINPGDKKWNVENINRVVGSFNKEGLKKAIKFYKSIISGNIRPMNSLREAEAVKIIENSFRDINIAFVNELAMSFSKLDIDIVSVIEGAATKPFAFLPHFPGCGVGGHCIPVDPYYLIEYAKENGFEHNFLALGRKINNEMPQFTAGLVIGELKNKKIKISSAKVAVLGLAYKSDIGDYRESPSFEIIKALKKSGISVASFDPFVLDKSSVQNIDDALKKADAVIIATAHKIFKNLSPNYFLKKGIKIIIDGRNCLPKDKFIKAGITYKGIGR